MAKRQIRIREALADVRMGLTETQLMDKYRLAAKGLQSLLTKLVASQLITLEELEHHLPGFMHSASLSEEMGDSGVHEWKIRRTRPGEGTGQTVRAADAISDIEAGMTDSQLMEKYRLSSKGLQDLFDQLIKAKLIAPTKIERRMPTMDRTVDLRGVMNELDPNELVENHSKNAGISWNCPHCGVSKDEEYDICPVCGNKGSRGQAERGAKLGTKRGDKTVIAGQVLQDVRAGLTDSELMEKYKIPYEKLDQIFRQLLNSNAITRGELYGRSSLFLDTAAVDSVQDDSTHYLAFPVPVSDAMDPSIVGRLRNVGDQIVGMIGIETEIDQERSFVVYPEKFVDVQPIAFDATCRWLLREPEGMYAGFEITFISDRDRERLEQLVNVLTLGD